MRPGPCVWIARAGGQKICYPKYITTDPLAGSRVAKQFRYFLFNRNQEVIAHGRDDRPIYEIGRPLLRYSWRIVDCGKLDCGVALPGEGAFGSVNADWSGTLRMGTISGCAAALPLT